MFLFKGNELILDDLASPNYFELFRWVRTVRDQKKFSFIEINDGSSLTGIQAVAESDIDSYGEVEKLTTGAAAEVIG